MTDLWRKLTLSDGDLELVCLPGIGGRLWDVVFRGQSILFQNPDLIDVVPDLKDLSELPTKSPQFAFPLWGGEKTWIAPDRDWVDQAPYPVLDSAPYKVVSANAQAIWMQSGVCPITHLRIDRAITLEGPNSWSIRHEIVNCGADDRLAGIWSVLMMKRPARIGMQADAASEIKAVFGNSEGQITRHDRDLTFACDAPVEFKSGVHNSSGLVLLRVGLPPDGIWVTCQTPASSNGSRFAHGHNIEVFNSADYPYCEAEWHAPATILRPGESQDFTQHFSVGSNMPLDLKDKTENRIKQELFSCMS